MTKIGRRFVSMSYHILLRIPESRKKNVYKELIHYAFPE